MVGKMVDEVEGRSYYGGSRVQVVQKIRDGGAMKLIFEKLHEYCIFPFETRSMLFFTWRWNITRAALHIAQREKEVAPLFSN